VCSSDLHRGDQPFRCARAGEGLGDLFGLSSVRRDDEQRCVAERFGLQSLGLALALVPATTQSSSLHATACATSDDGLPTGAISFFNLTACPAGWAPSTDSYGRFTVAVPATEGIALQVGNPLSNQANPTHEHSFASSIKVSSAEYVLIGGCCNHDLASDGTKNFSGDTDFSTTGLPYIQYLACEKTAAPEPTAPEAPQGTLMYFGEISCPAGWSEAITLEKRFLVGLPDGGQLGAAFGGPPLAAQEQRIHSHSFSGSVSTSSQDIAGASGCCAHGYGKNGSYPYHGTSGGASSEMPYLQLLM